MRLRDPWTHRWCMATGFCPAWTIVRYNRFLQTIRTSLIPYLVCTICELHDHLLERVFISFGDTVELVYFLKSCMTKNKHNKYHLALVNKDVSFLIGMLKAYQSIMINNISLCPKTVVCTRDRDHSGHMIYGDVGEEIFSSYTLETELYWYKHIFIFWYCKEITIQFTISLVNFFLLTGVSFTDQNKLCTYFEF